MSLFVYMHMCHMKRIAGSIWGYLVTLFLTRCKINLHYRQNIWFDLHAI